MSDVYIAQAQSANLSLILFLIKERARSSTHEGQKNNTGQRAIHQKVIGLRPQRIHPVERPAIGNEQLPIQPFAVLKGTRSYSPPKKRFSRKGLGVSTVCARTPRQPLLTGQQQGKRQARKEGANYPSKDAVASPRAIASHAARQRNAQPPDGWALSRGKGNRGAPVLVDAP